MEFLPLQMTHLTEEMIKRAEKELGETSEIRKRAIIEMRHIIKEEMKLNFTLDDNDLLQFLRARKFDVRRAVNTMKNLFNYKKNYKDVFGKTDFEALRRVFSQKLCLFLPYRNADGSIIMVLQLRHWNVAESDFAELIHALVAAIVLCIDLLPATQICGMHIIHDVKGVGMNHFLHMSPRIIHLMGKGLANALPVRLRGIHCVNESIIVKYAWPILRYGMSDKIRRRAHFHSANLESLHKEINPAVLPESLGGTLVYDNDQWMKTLEDFKHRYEEMMSFRLESET